MSELSGESPTEQERFGQQLRRIRIQAGFSSTTVLAARLDISQSAASRAERGVFSKSLPELVSRWAETCGLPEEQRAALVERSRELLTQSRLWRDELRGDPAAKQRRVQDLQRSARLHRVFTPLIVPGDLQTSEFARWLYRGLARLKLVDPAEAKENEWVQSRMRRQDLLYEARAPRFEFLVTEGALREQYGSPEVMIGQIDRLLSLALPNVRLGLLPQLSRPVPVPYQHGFVIYANRSGEDESTTVVYEPVDDERSTTDPTRVELFEREWELLARAAIYDEDAKELLRRIQREYRDLAE